LIVSENMKKNTIILVTAIILFLIAEFFVFFEFGTSTQQMTTIAEIESDRTAWVNKTVTVEGILSNQYFIQPWETSPILWKLTKDNQIILVAINATELKDSEYALEQILNHDSALVTVYGTLIIGYIVISNTRYGSVSIPPWTYEYIQAQKIILR